MKKHKSYLFLDIKQTLHFESGIGKRQNTFGAKPGK